MSEITTIPVPAPINLAGLELTIGDPGSVFISKITGTQTEVKRFGDEMTVTVEKMQLVANEVLALRNQAQAIVGFSGAYSDLSGLPDLISITGPQQMYPGTNIELQVENYDSFVGWSVSASRGSVSISDTGVILLVLDASEASGVVDIVVLAGEITRLIQVNVLSPGVVKPSVLTPIDGAVDIVESPTITLSSFVTLPAGFDTELSVSVRILNPDGSIAWQLLDQPPGTVFTVPENTLSTSITYKPQGRYQGSALGYSEWSDLDVSFTTVAAFGPTAAGTMWDGWIVADQIDGDWLLVATAANRMARKWGLANIDTSVANLGASTDLDTETGTVKTNILVSETYSTHVDNYTTTGCPAADYARSLGGDLPNATELAVIYSNLALIDSTDDSGGANTLAAIADGTAPSAGGDRNLWSSSERISSEAWRIQLQTGSVHNASKASTSMVVAVRRLPV